MDVLVVGYSGLDSSSVFVRKKLGTEESGLDAEAPQAEMLNFHMQALRKAYIMVLIVRSCGQQQLGRNLHRAAYFVALYMPPPALSLGYG